MNLFTASKQMRELDEFLRARFPRARGRTVTDRARWALADLENRLRQANLKVATATERGTITPAPEPRRTPPPPVPYNAHGYPVTDTYLPSDAYHEKPRK